MKNIVLAIISTVICLVVVITGISIYKINPFVGSKLVHMEGGFIFRDDEKAGFKVASNYSGTINQIEQTFNLYTDTLGARVSKEDKRVFDKQTQLLITGCSFSWGAGIDNKETYAYLLGNEGYKTINFAQPGYGAIQCLQNLETQLNCYHPNLVIYGVIADHWVRNVEQLAESYLPVPLAKPYVKSSGDSMEIKPLLFNGSIAETHKFYNEVCGADKFGVTQLAWAYKALYLSAKNFTTSWHSARLENDTLMQVKAMNFVLGKMLETCAEHNARFLVVYLPEQREINSKTTQQYPIPAGIQYISCIDLLKKYQQEHPDSVLYLINDGHPSGLANKLFTQQIVDYLKEKNFN